MEATQSLRRPSNWQDFESLCKKLWGEIWNCSEIKKNGRSGQEQNGVDIYGIPAHEKEYYGIQCKGKDEYTHKQFTEKEVLTEIDKVKLFRPPLKKLYFATTAVKDVKIESFIRELNMKNISNGLFEVHIFCWEDIVDLIDENKQTHDWYIKSISYKSQKSVSITFEDDSNELTINPVFKQVIHDHFFVADVKKYLDENKKKQGLSIAYKPLVSFEVSTNLSFSKFSIKLKNTGPGTIENFKLLLSVEDEIQVLALSNEIHNGSAALLSINSEVTLNSKIISAKFEPKQKTLVSEDVYEPEPLFIKPLFKEYTIKLKWKLISSDFKDDGLLTINVIPYVFEETIKYPEAVYEKVRIETGTIEDLIVRDNELYKFIK